MPHIYGFQTFTYISSLMEEGQSPQIPVYRAKRLPSICPQFHSSSGTLLSWYIMVIEIAVVMVTDTNHLTPSEIGRRGEKMSK